LLIENKPNAPSRAGAHINNMTPIRIYYKQELAMRYFPGDNPRVARDKLTRWINRCTPLLSALAMVQYRTTEKFYTPRQVELIFQYLGEP